MLALTGQQPRPGQTGKEYAPGAVSGLMEELGRLGGLDYPFVQGVRIATQGIGQNRPPIGPELKKMLTEPPKIFAKKRPPETLDMPVREALQRKDIQPNLAGKVGLTALSLASPSIFAEFGVPSTAGIARRAGVSAERALGEAAAKKAATEAGENVARIASHGALGRIAGEAETELVGREIALARRARELGMSDKDMNRMILELRQQKGRSLVPREAIAKTTSMVPADMNPPPTRRIAREATRFAERAADIAERKRIIAESGGESPFATLRKVAPKEAKRISLQAMHETNRVQAQGLQKLYSTMGEAAHIGEAASRGEATLFRFKVPGLPALETPGFVNRPALQGVAGIQRGIRQAAAKTGLASKIGMETAGVGDAMLSGFAGTRLPGELSGTGKEFAMAIPRQRIGQAMYTATKYRQALQSIFESGGGTSVEDLEQIRKVLDLPDVVAGQNLEQRAAQLAETRESRLAGIPSEVLQDKARRTGALLDYMLRKEQASGLSTRETAHYFPHILTGEYRNYRAATRPGFQIPPSGMRTGSSNHRLIQKGIDDANAASMKEHGFPIFKDNTLEALWLRGMDSSRARASITAYEKFMSEFGRPMKAGERLAPGEVMVISPGAFRDAMSRANQVTEKEANAILNVVLDADMVTGAGIVPTDAEKVLQELRQIRGLGKDKVYAVPAEVARNMNLYTQKLSEEIGDLPKLYSRALQVWKQETLLPFPAYHARNYLGNWTNAWLNGMSIEETVKYGTTAARILAAAETGKGLDVPYTIGGRTQTAQAWLDELAKNNVLKGGFVGTASRQSGHELIGAKRFQLSDLPSAIPLVPTFRKGAGSVGRRLELSLHNRIGRAIGGLAEGQPRAAVYFWQLEKGTAPEGAMQKVADTLWEFNEVPKLIQKSRGPMPFLGWTFKEAPFGFVKALQSPGKSALPARIYFSQRAAQGMGSPNSEFEADTGAIPIQNQPNGEVKMFPLMSWWAPGEAGRLLPESAPKIGSTFLGREARGLFTSGLGLLGPGEQFGARLGGISRTGKEISGTDISPQKFGPAYVTPAMKALLTSFRAINETAAFISPSKPRTMMERLAGVFPGFKTITVNPKKDASYRSYLDREAIRTERRGKRRATEPAGKEAKQSAIERLKEEQRARRAGGTYQP